MEYIKRYLEEVQRIAGEIPPQKVEKMIDLFCEVREQKGRVFFLGVGGSAANCTHAVNDFRKIGGMECYSPVDNVAELTARTNDEGWETVFEEYLKTSHFNSKDMVFVFSVGGGNKEKNISTNIVNAVAYAKEKGGKICGIVSRDGGFTAKNATECLIIPVMSDDTITPHAEAWQGVIWHMMVSHPRIMKMSNKWESVDKAEK